MKSDYMKEVMRALPEKRDPFEGAHKKQGYPILLVWRKPEPRRRSMTGWFDGGFARTRRERPSGGLLPCVTDRGGNRSARTVAAAFGAHRWPLSPSVGAFGGGSFGFKNRCARSACH